MEKPNILIFMSDQHNALYNGFAGHNTVETPNLDKIAEKGTVFDAAYTSCPLCVPARMSFLSGQLPSKTGIYTNFEALAENQTTFLHSLAAEGYETVLCGRMHFVGENQRHGFTKRIMGDFTPLYLGKFKSKEEQGPYQRTTAMPGCLDVIGGGNSPVLEYDRAVIKKALEYLEEDHDKPQCLVVGTYAPHFPYVAPEESYQYYKELVDLPETYQNKPDYDHSIIDEKIQKEYISRYTDQKDKVDEERVLKAQAAYLGMITNLDKQIGEVYQQWQRYLDKKQDKGIFIYLSDHGDTCGEHGIFGKQTFYEGSARIPMLIAGDGIKKQNRIEEPVSIMDIGPTLCDLTGAVTPPEQDGISLGRLISNKEVDKKAFSESVTEKKLEKNLGRYVISEYMETPDDEGDFIFALIHFIRGKDLESVQYIPGRMIRKGEWKYITYVGYEEEDLLFNIKEDPNETTNLIKNNQEIAEELKKLLYKDWPYQELIEEYKVTLKHETILLKWGKEVQPEEDERWMIPEKARQLPNIR